MRYLHLCIAALAGGVALTALPGHGVPHEAVGPSGLRGGSAALSELIGRLSHGPLTFISTSGLATPVRQHDDGQSRSVREQEILQALESGPLSSDQAGQLWSIFADEDNTPLLTLSIVKALLRASSTAEAHQALWSQLAGMAQVYSRKDRRQQRAGSLLGLFEADRAALLPLISKLGETEPACDDMLILMVKSRVFGASLEESASVVADRIPAAVASTIERERSHNRPVSWEYTAFESMAHWKDERLVPGGPQRPQTLAEQDAAGRTFITMFNSLHELDRGYREVLLRGLGPVEIFNAVVAGEKELYRLGTSGYRAFLHSIILQGIRDQGSYEAFLEQAMPPQPGANAVSTRRGMVFLRVASSFGLLDTVLETVRDRDRFIGNALVSLRDPKEFEENSSVAMDLLTVRTSAPAVLAFKGELLARLYAGYRADRGGVVRNVYGSLLSVYQTVSGDHRDGAIDREFPLDQAMFEVPFERLFSRSDTGQFVHRMLMRMDETIDDVETFKTFSKLVAGLGGTAREEEHTVVFTFAAPDRRIEIYANKPGAAGVRFGIGRIAGLLGQARVETVIGRGHTSIIKPLQEDARRVLGPRVKDVAAVFVGSCGGDASVRDLIATFGYVPFFTTKAMGRQVINNAILRAYIRALLALPPQDHLRVVDVLNRAVAGFVRDRSNEDLQADARLYQVNMTTVFTARLFDRHVRDLAEPWQSAKRD